MYFTTVHDKFRDLMEQAKQRLMKKNDRERDASEWMLLNDWNCENMDGDAETGRRIISEVGEEVIAELYKKAKSQIHTGLLTSDGLDAILTVKQIDRILGR